LRPLAPGGALAADEVPIINQLGAAWERRLAAIAPPAAALQPVRDLTVRAALELVSHEAIVQEFYLDSGNVGTWGVGVTSASGHAVERYRDNPQPIAKCLAVFVWLVRQHYLPAVLEAFGDFGLSEAQLAAALSFHYNTGAIAKTSWVPLARQGRTSEARAFLESHYLNDGVLTERRKAEGALFFDGKWSNDGTALIVPVAKPSYHPNFRAAKRVDITADMAAALVEPA
jgi:lysozyme